jgi:prophage maintenance system killer protein
VLAYGVAETQPVIDGNERLALVAILTFLELNGLRVSAADRELADWIIGFSCGVSPHETADLIRPRLSPHS